MDKQESLYDLQASKRKLQAEIQQAIGLNRADKVAELEKVQAKINEWGSVSGKQYRII